MTTLSQWFFMKVTVNGMSDLRAVKRSLQNDSVDSYIMNHECIRHSDMICGIIAFTDTDSYYAFYNRHADGKSDMGTDVKLQMLNQEDAYNTIAFLRRHGKYSSRTAPVGHIESDSFMFTLLENDGRQNEVAIAIETTGLDASKNEIIRLSAYGQNGDILYDRYFGIEHPESWTDENKRYSNVDPAAINGLETFKECVKHDAELQRLLSVSNVIIAHNALFLIEFLSAGGVNLDDKLFGDTCRCFRKLAMQNKWMNASATLQKISDYFKLDQIRAGHTEDKARNIYLIWLKLKREQVGTTRSLSRMRMEWLRSHNKKLSMQKKAAEKAMAEQDKQVAEDQATIND